MRTDGHEFVEFLGLDVQPQNRDKLHAALMRYFGPARLSDINALLDLVLARQFSAAERVQTQGVDKFYLDALVESVAFYPLVDGAAVIINSARQRRIGEEHDVLSDLRDKPDWSLIRCLNFLYRTKLKPRRKIAIVTSIRDEGINILEWIAHHRLLGIDDFIIYANDNDDGSTGLLNLLAAHGIIHIIWNQTNLAKNGGDMFPIQAKVYCHACEILDASRDFEWLLFSDMDEFLTTQKITQAPDALRPLDDLFHQLAAMERQPDAVALHWKWFGSFCEFQRRPGLNFRRFQYYIGSDHVKTIVRANACLGFSTSHLPRLPANAIVLDGALTRRAAPNFRMPSAYNYGQINHYWNKSFEEFITKHLRVRGDRTFENFFDFGNNRRRGQFEAVPEIWCARVDAEIKSLESLPGVEVELARIESCFTQQIAAFDAAHDNRALFARLKHKP